MKSKYLLVATVVALALQSMASATNHPPHGDKHHGDPINQSTSLNLAGAKSDARASADARATSDASASNNAQQAVNGGDQSITITGARQIASLAQGSWAAPECGTGGNAGGSGGGGAGFLGMYWTPADCKLMQIAYTWAHLGLYGEACKTLTATSTLRNAYKRYDLELPNCASLIAALTRPVAQEDVISQPITPVAPDMSQYATKEDLQKAFKQSVSK